MKRYKQRRDHKLGMWMAGLVVALLLVIVAFKGFELKGKLDILQEREAELTQLIEDQEYRSEEIAEFEKYTHTRKFIEEIAREKLGLIYDGEIIFRNTGNK